MIAILLEAIYIATREKKTKLLVILQITNLLKLTDHVANRKLLF